MMMMMMMMKMMAVMMRMYNDGNEPQVQIWCEAKTFCTHHPCLSRPSTDNNTHTVMMTMMTKTIQYDDDVGHYQIITILSQYDDDILAVA